MERGRVYQVVSSGLRVTSVAWLISTPTRLTVHLVNPQLSAAGDYLLSVTVVMLGLYVAATVLGCETKPYAEAMVSTLVLVVFALGVPDPMTTAAGRVLVYSIIATVIVLLVVHGALELRTSPVWGSSQLLAPVTALALGLAGELGPARLELVTGSTIPPILVTGTLAGLVFAAILEVQQPAHSAVEG